MLPRQSIAKNYDIQLMTSLNKEAINFQLKHIEVGLCVIDESRNLLFSNEEANRIIRKNNTITLDENHILYCRCKSDNDKLVSGLSLTFRPNSLDDKKHNSVICLKKEDSKNAHLVFIGKIDNSQRRDRNSVDPDLALVLLVDLNRRNYLQLELLTTVFTGSKKTNSISSFESSVHTQLQDLEKYQLEVEFLRREANTLLKKQSITNVSYIILLVAKLFPQLKNHYVGFEPFSNS